MAGSWHAGNSWYAGHSWHAGEQSWHAGSDSWHGQEKSELGAPITLEVSIAVSADDARQVIATSVVSLTDSNMSWNQANIIGLRFQFATPIPQGRTILSAVPSVVPSGTSSTVWTGRIRGQASGNAAQFQAVNNDISDRTATTTAVDVIDPSFVLDVRSNLPDITSVIQEIVNAAELSALVLILTEVSGDTRAIRAYDNDPAKAAAIVITYLG